MLCIASHCSTKGAQQKKGGRVNVVSNVGMTGREDKRQPETHK